MSLFTKLPTPNSRLLYIDERVCEWERWQMALNLVESEIRGDLRMEEANSSICFYFFVPASEWGREERYWIGREIIGAVTEKKGRLSLHDWNRGHCYRTLLGRFPEDLALLKERETELRRDYEAEYSAPPGKTWRISFDSFGPDEIFLEFFAEE